MDGQDQDKKLHTLTISLFYTTLHLLYFLILPIKIVQRLLYLNYFQNLHLVYMYQNFKDFEEHL